MNLHEAGLSNPEIEQQLQYLIGSRYVPAVKAYISELTSRNRVVGPNDVSTKELDRTRIHIKANSVGNITAFTFS